MIRIAIKPDRFCRIHPRVAFTTSTTSIGWETKLGGSPIRIISLRFPKIQTVGAVGANGLRPEQPGVAQKVLG
jgi:hypothetical protein